MYEHSHESPSLCERHVDAANPSVRPHETCPLEPEVTPCGYPMEMSSFSESRAFGPAPHVKFEGQMRDVVLPGLFGERHSLGDLSNPE